MMMMYENQTHFCYSRYNSWYGTWLLMPELSKHWFTAFVWVHYESSCYNVIPWCIFNGKGDPTVTARLRYTSLAYSTKNLVMYCVFVSTIQSYMYPFVNYERFYVWVEYMLQSHINLKQYHFFLNQNRNLWSYTVDDMFIILRGGTSPDIIHRVYK